MPASGRSPTRRGPSRRCRRAPRSERGRGGAPLWGESRPATRPVSTDGGLDAELLADYIAAFADPEAFAVSHIGWGLQDRARWSTLGLYDREATIGMDGRAFAGNFLFSLGSNSEAGGDRHTACHIDIPMRRCTVRLDGAAVVEAGVVVNERVPA